VSIKPDTQKQLEDFVKRVDYIRSLSYFDGKDKVAGFQTKMVEDKLQVDFYQPSDEKRDALLFNFRLFIQDKDDISLRRLVELYDDPGVSDFWKNEHKHYREKLNEWLDFVVVVEGEKGELTNRDVLEMFLYGKFGHRDEDDKSYKMYQEWVNNEAEFEIMHNTFHTILISILAVIMNLSVASREELQRHGITFLPLDTSASPS
jgi:hypothetical protein